MSLDPCRPLSPLSLSLTSLLSRPVSIQGSGVGSPEPHSHLRVGRGFNGGGLSRREGRFSLYIFVRRSLQEGGTLLVFRRSFQDASGRRHGARSFVWLAGTVSGPDPFGLFRTTSISRASAGSFSRVLAADSLVCGSRFLDSLV
jgi:hypothetical protein